MLRTTDQERLWKPLRFHSEILFLFDARRCHCVHKDKCNKIVSIPHLVLQKARVRSLQTYRIWRSAPLLVRRRHGQVDRPQRPGQLHLPFPASF